MASFGVDIGQHYDRMRVTNFSLTSLLYISKHTKFIRKFK